MTAPSKSFTSIADSEIDANSPLTVTLLTEIRDNLTHLEEWLGKNYTAAVDHNHDGVNSAPVVFSGLAGIDGLSGIEMVRKTSNETVGSSTTLQNDDELLASLAANENIGFFCLISATSQTGDIKLAFTVPTGASLAWAPPNGIYYDASDTITQTDEITASGTSLPFGLVIAGPRQIAIWGRVANGANAGNLQLQWAQQASSSLVTTVLAGSKLFVWRE